MGDTCMKLSAEEPSRSREAENPIFARDIASRIEGVSSRECATNLICRNETCQAMPNSKSLHKQSTEYHSLVQCSLYTSHMYQTQGKGF